MCVAKVLFVVLFMQQFHSALLKNAMLMVVQLECFLYDSCNP